MPEPDNSGWELIQKGPREDNAGGWLHRLPVPGGWIYRQTFKIIGQTGNYEFAATAMVFVPNPDTNP